MTTPTPRRHKKKSTSIIQDTIAKTDNVSTGNVGSDVPKKENLRRRRSTASQTTPTDEATTLTGATQDSKHQVEQTEKIEQTDQVEQKEQFEQTDQVEQSQNKVEETSQHQESKTVDQPISRPTRRRRIKQDTSTSTTDQNAEDAIELATTEEKSDTTEKTDISEQEISQQDEGMHEENSSEESSSDESSESSSQSDQDISDTEQDMLDTVTTEAESVPDTMVSDLESNTGFVQGTIGNAVIRAHTQKTEISKEDHVSKDKESKEPVLGKAVIALPDDYDPNKPKSPKSKEIKNLKEERWNDLKGTREKRDLDKTDRGEKGEKGKRAERFANTKKTRRESRRIIEQRIEYKMEDIGSNTTRKKQRSKKKGMKKISPKAKAIKRRVFVDTTVTVGELAHGMSVKVSILLKKLIDLGQIATINDELDIETASLLAEEFEYEIVNTTFQEEDFFIQDEEEEEGNTRPPVVTIMGHVDHGKTTLLDSIRKANVAGGEAGGITQHLSAYQVTKNDQLITFIDTPGHAAFTAMRERGAQVTDIVVLVVAADDGVMPQTIEALNHAKAADVQLMVAINKCDKPGANPDRVKQQLMNYELIPEEYGGDTMMIEVSALQGLGIDDLLESILLLAEIGEYEAPIDRHAEGSVLEAKLEKGRGAVATILVKKGTLKIGDSLVLGKVWGRVRAITDYRGKEIKEATPSMPVEITGIQDVPTAGDDFIVVKSDKDARTLVEHRMEEEKLKSAEGSKGYSLEDLIKMQQAGETLKLNLIIKSDVGGTLEAMKASLDNIKIEGTEVKIIHSAVGAISESDIILASINECIVIGFNVRPDSKARQASSSRSVDVRTYKVIYEALQDIEKALKGMLSPDTKEVIQGHAEIRQVIPVPKVGNVCGCYVTNGKIARSHSIRLLRQGNIIWEGKLASLRRFKDDVKEVNHGYECGMNLDGFNDIKEGDEIEAYTMEEVPE